MEDPITKHCSTTSRSFGRGASDDICKLCYCHRVLTNDFLTFNHRVQKVWPELIEAAILYLGFSSPGRTAGCAVWQRKRWGADLQACWPWSTLPRQEGRYVDSHDSEGGGGRRVKGFRQRGRTPDLHGLLLEIELLTDKMLLLLSPWLSLMMKFDWGIKKNNNKKTSHFKAVSLAADDSI